MVAGSPTGRRVPFACNATWCRATRADSRLPETSSSPPPIPRASWVDSFQPDLSPIGIDATRASPMVIGLAHDAVEYQTVVWETHHPSGALVDNVFNTREDLERPAAVLRHLDVEEEPTIATIRVESRGDLLTLPDLHDGPRLEIETEGRRLRQVPAKIRKRIASAQALEGIVEPELQTIAPYTQCRPEGSPKDCP